MLSGILEKMIVNDPGLLEVLEAACDVINGAKKNVSGEKLNKEPAG